MATQPPARPVGQAKKAKKRNKRAKITPRQREEAGEGALNRHWRTYFLQSLAASSNVSLAAEAAGVSSSRAYKVRREEPAFAAAWSAALHEGYDHLEMELLAYLRDPAPVKKMDVAAALRLLAAHRETVERRRALTEEEDEDEVRASIDRFIDAIRVNRAANTPLLEARPADDEK